jgi:hypothetical protein
MWSGVSLVDTKYSESNSNTIDLGNDNNNNNNNVLTLLTKGLLPGQQKNIST